MNFDAKSREESRRVKEDMLCNEVLLIFVIPKKVQEGEKPEEEVMR
jgi:hypothetical protein